MDAAEAAQEVAANTGGSALNMLISKTSESFTFQIQTDNTAIGMAIAVGVLGAGVGVGLAALRLAEHYYGGEKKKRETRDAFGRAFGGDRPDRDVGDINRGCLLVDLHCYTAESFLEFLADYESGKVKERLKEELSKIGIDVEHLTVEIKNLKEAEERRRKLRIFWSENGFEAVVMTSLEDLFRYYVENIIAQAEKGPSPNFIQQNLDKCRHIIRCNLFTPEWWMMGYDSQLVSLLLRLGDDFFSKGDVEVALNFFNEALCLFPYIAICHFKVAQCRSYMGEVHLAKKHSFAAIRCSEDTRVPLEDDYLTKIVQMLMDADELNDALQIAERILRKSRSNDVVQSQIREIKLRRVEKKREVDERKRKEEEKKKSLAENRKKVEKRVGQKTPVSKIEKSSKERKKEEIAKQKKVDEEIKKKQAIDEKEKEREEEERKSKQTTKLPAKKTTTFPGYDVNVALEATRPKKGHRSSRPELKNQRNEKVVTPQLVDQLKSSLVGQPPSNPGKLSMDNISASMDDNLSSGSVLRRICPKCRTPQVVKLQTKKCHICKSELELFYRKVKTTTWTKPRKPPENVKPGKYTQCRHFQLGKRCARTPCTFAHGQDEVEIWELCRGKSRRRTRNKTMATMQRSSSCMTLYDPNVSIGLRSRTQSQSSAYSLQFPCSSLSIASGPGDVSSLDDFESRSMTGSLSYELSQDTWDLNVLGPDECDFESITSSPAPDGGHSEIELAPTVVTDEETSPDLTADAPHASTEDQSDDGWTTVSTKAKKKQSRPDSLKKKLTILCGYCCNVISSVDTPEAGPLLCNNCNRTEQPSYQYWDEKTERWCTLRSKPPGITNVRICWHYTNHSEDHVMDNCKFAHGYYENILWKNQIKEGKSKKKKTAVLVQEPAANSSYSSRDNVSLLLNLEKLRCRFCDIQCSSSRELHRHNSEPQHKLAIAKKIIVSEPGAPFASGPGTELGSGPGAAFASGPGIGLGSGPGVAFASGPGIGLGSGLGAPFTSGTGVGLGSGPGAAFASGTGVGLGSGPGAAFARGTGVGLGSGSGAELGSAPGAAYASGTGTGLGSAPGAAFASGPGTGLGSAPGVGLGSASGAGFGSGPEAGSGLRAGLAAWPGYGTGPRPGYGAWFGRGPVSSRACRPPPNVYMGRYKLCHRFVNHGWCYLSDKCTFAHGTKEKEQWIEIYIRQSERISQLEKNELLVESFSQKIRRLEKEGRVVLKDNLPGVILNCSSESRKELNKPQDHCWIFDVRIDTTKRKLLNQVALLSEDHLDKFQLLQTSEESEQTIIRQSVELREDDFVEDSENDESAVQFCVKFTCRVFGEFEQKLVLDFGDELYLSRTLIASIMSDDVREKQKKPGRSVYCQILEWSLENMELSLCPELIDDEGLRELYNIPCDLPEPATIEEFSRETYCKLWHDILFNEELHIQKEVARYDIRDGKMKLIREFQDSVDRAVYALPGELFGEISLEDYLVMDEASGHLFQRSVLSVIIRLKEKNKSERKKVYECLIKLKTAQSVIVQLNQELCEDHVLQNKSIVNIDLKVKYNRLPMCEMHQAIDRCKEKTTCLLPLVKPVSNRSTKSISTWFMVDKPNGNQHEAITLILDPSPAPPLLIYGPFGTGKTFTLNMACVEILYRSKTSKVLICTHSNSAADIHLDHLHTKLKKKRFIRPVRILNPIRNLRTIPDDLLQYCLLDGNTPREPTWNDLQSCNVIITTLASSRVLWKFFDAGKLRFTHILIDEAAQALEPECITPLSMASEETKIVLAGDHVQMGPLAYSKRFWAEGLGPSRSLLERLFALYKTSVSQQKSSGNDTKPTKPPHTVMLTENYRCHERILAFPSDCLYGKELVARGKQPLHPLFPALSFYTAQGRDEKLEGSLAYYNLAEVDEVAKRVEELFNLWPDCWGEPKMESIGVLSPYHDQVRMIRNALKRKRLRDVNVQTVENVQGQEFRALFISIVRTGWTCWEIEGRNSEREDLDFGFLSDIRLLNTAVTRAQSMLVVVGDPMSLCGLGACRDIWRDYLKRCHDDNGLYGCTLKTIMDSCLFSRVLDPCAQEFVPTEAHHKSSESETPTKELENPGDSLVIQEDRNDHSVENGAESKPTTMTNDKSVENGSTNELQNSASTSADTPDGPHSDVTAAENVDGANEEEGKEETTEDFFSQIEANEDFDEIIKALVQACKETKKKDEVMKIEETSNEEFPPLSDAATVSSAPPQWPRLPKTTPVFSAGMRNGRIELGFHVKPSERLFRLTGGTSSFQTSEDRPCNDPQAYNHEELLALLEANPEVYSKCSFHADFGGRQRRYYGQVPDPGSPDIYIPGRVRCIYEDDLVVVEKHTDVVLLNDDVQPLTGVIKGVLRTLIDPKERQFVCTVDRNNLGVMTPINKASPRLMNFTKTDEKDIIPIYKMNDGGHVTKAVVLRGNKVNEALAQERVFVVKFLQWRFNCTFPLGLAVRHLPSGRDFETGIEILYEEYNVKRKFSRKVLENCNKKFGNPEDWKLPAREKARPAYRSNVFTVDPPQSRDLDDAISVRVLDNGNYEVQIHIADVSYFVQPNTSLDDEAKSRGTSYYPPKPHEPVPMLPRELSEGCCSLLEGKDRLAMTLSVELSEDGMMIGEPKIERTVIRSCCRLTYHEAQEVIDEGMSKDGSFDRQGEVIEVQDGVEVNEQEVVVIEESIKYDPGDEVETTDDETLMESKKAKRKKKKKKKKENSEVERDKREEMEKRRNDIKTREEMLNEAEKKDVAQAKNGETQEAEKRKKDIPRNVKEALLISHKLAVNLRKSRLGERSLYHRKDDDGDDEDTAAHEMIAELMIMANHAVAKYLLKKYPQCTPLRVQPPPKTQRVKEWKSRFQNLERYSFGIKSLSNTEQEEEKELDIQVPSKTWNKIMSTLNLTADHDANLQEPTGTRDTNSEELVKLVCDLDQYPQLALAYAHQQRLQQRASYTCSGEIFATVPREDSETVPREDSATVPREDSETVPREDSEDGSGDSETVPRGDSEDGAGDSEIVPPGDSETVPRGDSETVPRGDSESVPRGDSEDGAGDSETVPPGDSETVPRDSETIPRGDSETVPRGDSEDGAGDSEIVPPGDSETVPRGDSETVPRGDSESVPRGDSEDGAGDSETVPPGDSETVPRGDSETIPRGDSGTVPRDSETIPRGDSETVPREDPENVSRGLSEIVLQGRSENVLRGHSSLELDAYCHFTSPIRRYIDLVVHRLIVKSIEHDESQEADQQHPVYTTMDMTAICDRCTFLSRNSRRFDKDARKLQLAENLQNAMTFVNALIDEVERDNLKLFFGSKDLDSLRGQDKSVRIARLGPDHVSEPQGDQVTLEWKLRVLKLDKRGRSQPVLHEQDEEEMSNTESQTQVNEEEKHVEFNVPGDKWRGLLDAVKNDDHDLLKKRVQYLNELVQHQSPSTNSSKLSVLKKVENPPPESSSSSHENHASREPYQHPNTGKSEPDVEDTDEFYSVKKSFKPCDRVKVQLCSQVLRGMLTPNVQLFEITDKIHVCVEHRTYPTKCFAKVSSKYASRSEFSDIEQYLYLWKPVLMMEIATSAVRENDVITLCNLRVTLSRDPETKSLTLQFTLFKDYCKVHELDVFDLNLMCVRIKDPRSRGTQAGFWVGHFQINKSSKKKNKEKDEQVFEVKAQQVFEVKARLINSSSPIPQVLLDNKVCFVTAELICLSTPDRRRLGALTYTESASELIQNICIGEVSVEDIEGNNLPRELSLANVGHSLQFRPLNAYQQRAVKEALSKAFTLIQGPPGTGKTVTGVHIAYWFAQMNEERMKKERMNKGKVNKERLSEEGEQEESNLAMVFYCGPSNKSVDVVGRYLKKIPGVKILRIYGQEIERKEFPVPDKLIVFREKRISSQLKTDEELRDVSLHHVIRSNECPFADELKGRYDEIRNAAIGEVSRKMIDAYNRIKMQAEEWAMTSNGVQIILCTCTSAYSPRIEVSCYAYCQCIVDECGMCIEAETLCAMVGSNAAQVVLIGDHKQLQPVIQCDKAKDLGLGISMFERYSGWAQMLEIQYRMHQEICEFPSKYFYDGKLQTADQVRDRTTDEIDLWPKGPDFPFVFYHVVGKEESLVISTDQGNENSKRNRKEISKAVYLARELVRSGVSGDRIVVLSPYRAQCHEINEQLKQHGLKGISVMTVVAGQGSEKDFVILSLVRSLPNKEIDKNPSHSWLKENLGFITDEHQINVALTRSRRGLCIVGNANLVGVCSIWKALLEHYDEKGCLVSDDPSLVPDLHRRR